MNLEPLGQANLEDLLPLVAEYHAFEGIDMPEADRRAVLDGLLGAPNLGGIWAVVEAGEWIGYVALTHGYSIEFRGRDAFIDELFIREPHRGRGIGTRVLEAVRAYAASAGIRALHLEVDRGNAAARVVYARLGFETRDRFSLMSLKLGENVGRG